MDLNFRRDPDVLCHIVDAMADGVFTVDASGRFVAWSEGAERITGYSEAELLGQPCRVLEGPNCKGFATLAELLESEAAPPDGICNQECKLLSKGGDEVYVHGNVRVLTDDEGHVSGAVGTFTDLTSFVRTNERVQLLEEQVRRRDAFGEIVGRSGPMQEVFRRIRLAAQSDVTVFVSGESGTGKELVARAVHAESSRHDGPFIAVNCSAIPETLLESELFGHVKGAFTGAVRDKTGVFQQAEGGTLFLDEIGDLSPLIQLKLLRVVQEREIRRVGDDRAIPVDVRLVTATNRELRTLVATGEFREDFYYRIHVFEIALPSLRDRRDDIPILADHFVSSFSRDRQRNVNGIARDALQRMLQYEWPGNVRELRNAIEHAFVTVQGETISLLDLPPEVRDPQPAKTTGSTTSNATPEPAAAAPAPLTEAQAAERDRIAAALVQTGGNRTQAAKLLGTSRVTLWKKVKRYGLEAAGQD